MRSTHFTHHYYKPHQADADPSRHVVPSRPLQSKYEEADSKIHRHEAQTHVKNRYKSKFIISDQKRLQTHATLTASPHFGNAGKPRPQRKRQLKVDRTKSHRTDVHKRWNTTADKNVISVNDDPKLTFNSKRKSRRSNVAYLLRKSNRTQKRQERRKQFRMVRKCFSVPAPREDTYHGAQEGMTNQPTDETNDVFLKLSGELRIATFNCKGANHISAREKIVRMMKTHKLDILFLQETHINTNTAEIHDQYCFVFSTDITDKQREDADKIRELSGQRKGKGKHNSKNSLQLYNLDAEKLGTAVIYHKRLERSKLDVVQHDNRNITLSLKSKGGVMNITGTHAPHSAKSTLEKTQYYQTLGRICNTYGNHNQHFILGDFNAKLSKDFQKKWNTLDPTYLTPTIGIFMRYPKHSWKTESCLLSFV